MKISAAVIALSKIALLAQAKQPRLSATLVRNKTPRRRLPLPLKLLQQFPVLRRIPARMLGLGFRPEHVCTHQK